LMECATRRWPFIHAPLSESGRFPTSSPSRGRPPFSIPSERLRKASLRRLAVKLVRRSRFHCLAGVIFGFFWWPPEKNRSPRCRPILQSPLFCATPFTHKPTHSTARCLLRRTSQRTKARQAVATPAGRTDPDRGKPSFLHVCRSFLVEAFPATRSCQGALNCPKWVLRGQRTLHVEWISTMNSWTNSCDSISGGCRAWRGSFPQNIPAKKGAAHAPARQRKKTDTRGAMDSNNRAAPPQVHSSFKKKNLSSPKPAVLTVKRMAKWTRNEEGKFQLCAGERKMPPGRLRRSPSLCSIPRIRWHAKWCG